MAAWRFPRVKMSLVVAACLCGLVAAGCNDHVQITRDPDVRIARGATWAWQPSEPRHAKESRRVLSRDEPRRNERNEPEEREPSAENQLVQDKVKRLVPTA